MINSGDGKYHDVIKQSCNNLDDRIKSTAIWGYEKLGI
jgi:hypothetical protein